MTDDPGSDRLPDLLADVDLEAWQPPAPPAGVADAVLHRMREPAPVSAREVREVEERSRWRWWIATSAIASAAAGGGLLMSFWFASSDPVIQGQGDVIAARPSHVALGASSAEIDAGTELHWRRDHRAVAVQQPRGVATWRVDPADVFTIDPGAVGASIEASGASLRVEVHMHLSKSSRAARAAAAVALVTVIVYSGEVQIASAGQSMRAQAGDTVEVTPGGAPREVELSPVIAGVASGDPAVAGAAAGDPASAGDPGDPVIAGRAAAGDPAAGGAASPGDPAMPGAAPVTASPGRPASPRPAQPRPSPARPSPATPALPAEAVPAGKTRNVPPNELEANRIRGNKNIMPDEFVKRAIQAAGETRVVASAKLCIDTAGEVSEVRILKSSGYPGYDETIVSEMKQWGFRPYEVDGKPVAVCTAITFIYSQR
jgi:TonB family protein